MSQVVETKTPNVAANAPAPEAQAPHRGPVYKPAVDVFETPEEVVIVAATPGAASDGIDVSYEEGVLTLHAKVASRAHDAKYLLREYGVGDYYRQFTVGERIDASKVTAEYRDGLVRIHLPKSEAAKPRKIVVNSSN